MHLTQRPHQPERVAASDEHRLGIPYRTGHVARLVQAGDPHADPGQRVAHDCGVGVRMAAGKRHEQHAGPAAQHVLDGLDGVLQEAQPRSGRIRQEQQLTHNLTLVMQQGATQPSAMLPT